MLIWWLVLHRRLVFAIILQLLIYSFVSKLYLLQKCVRLVAISSILETSIHFLEHPIVIVFLPAVLLPPLPLQLLLLFQYLFQRLFLFFFLVYFFVVVLVVLKLAFPS